MAVKIRAVLLIEAAPAAGATDTLTATRPFRIYDYVGQITIQAADNTVVTNGVTSVFGNLSNNGGGAGTLVRATTIDPATDDVIAGDLLNVAAGAVGTQNSYISIIPRAL